MLSVQQEYASYAYAGDVVVKEAFWSDEKKCSFKRKVPSLHGNNYNIRMPFWKIWGYMVVKHFVGFVTYRKFDQP